MNNEFKRVTAAAAAHSSRPLELQSVKINDPYWTPYLDLVRDTVIPYQLEALNDRIPGAEPSYAVANFRIAAGLAEGEFGGMVFQDSDLYKWLEAVGYSLAVKPDEDLEREADELIDLIASAQQEDGYLNTYFTVAEPGARWTNLTECHELYCAGHMIEAAVAYYRGTGKTRLLDVAKRMADYISSVFGTGEGQIRGYDGHQEIELALVKLYEATGEKRYLNLSLYFINERGQQPSFFHKEWERRGRTSHWSPGTVQLNPPDLSYFQAHKQVREQESTAGHAVRAVYMYTAMADLAVYTGDEGLLEACRRLWRNTVRKQMYINGSIGSTHHGEAFTFDYDLPNDTNYSETCASIGLIFFASRMLRLEMNGEYADVLERALYNTVTAGIARDGKHYFYVNPMEVWPEASEQNPGRHHVKPVRQQWYGCACCPPNITRLLSSLGQYVFTAGKDTLYVHLYIGSETRVAFGGDDQAAAKAVIKLDSSLPWQGEAKLTVSDREGSGRFTLALRVPSWSHTTVFTLNGKPVIPEIRDGYAYLEREWQEGDQFAVSLDMRPQRIYANPLVRADAGKVALQRGPLVYCLEETDNGALLPALSLPRDAEIREAAGTGDVLEGAVLLEVDGLRLEDGDWTENKGEEDYEKNDRINNVNKDEDSLYRSTPAAVKPQKLTAVPYTLWGNRKPGEMLVWIRE
ncbi:glycoside hydrolase family 127 protein [Paenibacillus yonginensis]|uniref:glycoside hydrolase family 127 protein n=1 Tax=Paenibacillus yonginensis TaxID=1462996 RepID=UPI0009F4B219|nr:beta-L-arabinofuranosidase domain-containing protein [Paenibacillus yonginensis]